jgi:hypothetical protein
MELDNLSDETIGGVREKERLFEETVRSSGYLYGKFWADSWCAALAWRKTNHLPYPITEEVFRRIETNPCSVDPWLRGEVERLASPDVFHFFHWHLAFPEVFHVDRDSVGPAGWSGGFDVVLVRFIHQSSRLESMARALAVHVVVSQAAQFFVNDGGQALNRALVSVAPGAEEPADLV